MADSGSKKRTFGVSDFFELRRRQVCDEVAQVCKANFEAKFPTWDDRIDNFSPEQLVSCLAKLNSNIEVVKRKITLMKGDDKHKLLQFESRSFDARSRPSSSDNYNISAAALCPWNQNHSDNHMKHSNLSEFEVIGEQLPPLPAKPIDIHRPSFSHADDALVKLSLSLNPMERSLRMPMMNNDLDFGVRSGVASCTNNSIPNNVTYNPPPSFFVHRDPRYGMPNNDIMFDPTSMIPVLHDPSRSSAMFKEPNAATGTWFNGAPSMHPAEVATYDPRQHLMMPDVYY